MRRRQFLRLSAASLLAAPFVHLATSRARGASPTEARRLLVFFSPNGTIPHRWSPQGQGSSYQFGADSILAPLAGMEPQLTVLGGVDFNVGDNHEGGMSNMLTAGGPISIDQAVADHIGGSTRFRSLELSALTSAWGGSSQTRMCYRNGSFITPDDDPISVWSRLFGEAVGGADPRLAERRQSVLDLTNGELKDLQKRLGREEKIRLDAHLEGLRTVERALFGESTCESPVAPSLANPQDNDAFPDVVRAQSDLAVQALACGATNVVSLQLSHTVSPVVFRWVGQSSAHHELSHSDDGNTGGVQGFVDCEQWVAGQFRYVLEQLSAAVDAETGGSLLESTLVLWVKELGDSRLHVTKSVPWVLAGAGFETGRHLQVDTTHDRVLTSVANAFGMNLGSFGSGTGGPVEAL